MLPSHFTGDRPQALSIWVGGNECPPNTVWGVPRPPVPPCQVAAGELCRCTYDSPPQMPNPLGRPRPPTPQLASSLWSNKKWAPGLQAQPPHPCSSFQNVQDAKTGDFEVTPPSLRPASLAGSRAVVRCCPITRVPKPRSRASRPWAAPRSGRGSRAQPRPGHRLLRGHRRPQPAPYT